MTPRILVVAGSDAGGGAGIQADIKTVMALGGHAMTAITAITAQNTLGVQRVMPIPAAMVVAQMASVLDDIGADAVKIGMIGSAETAHAVADALAARPAVPVVFDPVMVATSGAALADAETIAAFERLMALCTIVTPNVAELAALTGVAVATEEEGQAAASALSDRFGCAVLAKGGHRPPALTTQRLRADGTRTTDEIGDALILPAAAAADRAFGWSGPKIVSRHTHGTGCTLASGIACGLGRGLPLVDAITVARAFVRDAMRAAPGLGGGHGPMGHGLVAGPALDQVTLPLLDYSASVAFYRMLGLHQIVAAEPRYARFEAPNGVTLSIEAGGQAGDAVVYFEADDLDARVMRLAAAGIAFESGPRDERWGWREARLRDPAGNRLCLFRAGTMRRFPPWRLPDGEG